MTNSYQHRRLHRSPLTMALAAVLLVSAGNALAQSSQTEQDQKSEEAKKKEAATNLDKITVTGSRIAKDTFNSVSPVQVINREETTMAGFNSTTAVLQSNTVTGGSSQINNAYSGYVVNGGGGVNTLSLRGLGATRTLLLLNGRRVAPAGSRGAVGSADLNVLPNIMVDHVEILKDGASSIYGSDAVAGVVNIVTRKKFDGAVVEFQQNATQHGGGNETRWSAMAGSTHDNWWISGSLEIYRRDTMLVGDRDWASNCPVPLAGLDTTTGKYGADDYIDPATGKPKCWTLDAGGVTINTIGTATLTGVAGPGVPGTRFNRWRPNASVTTGLPGYEGVDYYGRDSFSKNMLNEPLLNPTTNFTGFLQGGIDVGALGDAEVYYEVLTSRRKSATPLWRQLSLDYPVGSPLLGSLSGLPAWLAAPSDGSTNGQNVSVRAFLDAGMTDSRQQVDFYRATAGMKGNLGAQWNYDFSVSTARSDADYMIESFLTNRYAKSLNVVSDGNGGFRCVDVSDGCVAAPMLTASLVNGNLPQAWRSYILQPTTGRTIYAENTANLNVNGPLFDLPYGTVRGAFGLEWRKARIDDQPAPESVANNLYGLTASQPTKGSDAVKEAYAEIELPLLSGLPGAQELTVNLSGRYTDYDSYGSDKTWKVGMLYTPVSWLSLRASRGTSFRAPALFEQFLGATSGFNSASGDPCNDWGSKNPASPTYQNCSSLGLPADFNQTSSIRVYTKGGAETGLAAETSVAQTAGIVLQPEFPAWFGDLSFAADYYDIQVNNGVARLTGAQVLGLCYGSQPADFTAGNGYCSLVQRDNNNYLTVTTGYVNVSTSKVRGWDFTLRYVRDIGLGELRASAIVSHYLQQAGKTFPDDPLLDHNGTLGAPDMTGQLDLAYKLRKWTVRYGLEWVAASNDYDYYEKYYDTDYRPDYKMSTPDYFLHNVSLQYKNDSWSVTGGVRNLADKDPPAISTAAGGTYGNALLYSGYDFNGRTFFVNFTLDF